MNPAAAAGAPELVVEGHSVKQDVALIRVPEFVADIWDVQPPGTCIAVLQNDNTLRLAKTNPPTIVNKLIGQAERLSNDVVIGSATQPLDEIPHDAQMLGVLSSSTTFLPNLMDPAYRQFLADQRAAKESLQQQNRNVAEPQVLSLEASLQIEQARTSGGAFGTGADEGMFKYFKEDGLRVVQTSGGVTDSQMEAASAALFRLFEAAPGGTLSHRDIQQSVHLPPHHLRRLLDQLTEPQTERLGRKSVFRLKPQFRKV